MRIGRMVVRLFGLVCIALAVLLGLSALAGFAVSEDVAGRIVAAVVAAGGLLLALIGARTLRGRAAGRPVAFAVSQPASRRVHTGLRFEDFRWGDPPPSRKQFGYAVSLGAQVRHGMSKWMVSDAIDEAIEAQRSGEPATKEQLRTIREHHGVLPRTVTRGEARRIIELLEDYALPCPFCGIEVMASDDACCACTRSLRPMRIPIKL